MRNKTYCIKADLYQWYFSILPMPIIKCVDAVDINDAKQIMLNLYYDDCHKLVFDNIEEIAEFDDKMIC